MFLLYNEEKESAVARYQVILMTKDGEKLKHETDNLQEALSMLTSTSIKIIDTEALGKDTTKR